MQGLRLKDCTSGCRRQKYGDQAVKVSGRAVPPQSFNIFQLSAALEAKRRQKLKLRKAGGARRAGVHHCPALHML